MIRKWRFNLVLVVVMGSLMAATAFGSSLPKSTGFVNDFANVMDSRSRAEVQLIAQALREDQGVELAVVTMPTVSPYVPKDYAVTLFNEWGIGGPEDSGLLILLVMDERQVEVEVGYGLEGVLPDGKVGAILDQVMVPYLGANDYGRGLSQGAQAFRGELIGESFLKSTRAGETADWVRTFIIFLAIAIFISLRSRRFPPGGPGGNSRYPRRMGGGFGGTTRPRSGGGFGGFGGGRSGGGGAGRKF